LQIIKLISFLTRRRRRRRRRHRPQA